MGDDTSVEEITRLPPTREESDETHSKGALRVTLVIVGTRSESVSIPLKRLVVDEGPSSLG